MSKQVFRVAVAISRSHPALRLIPAAINLGQAKVTFHRTFDENFKDVVSTVESCIYFPPTPISELENVWKVNANVKWLHCFFAGCDDLMPFIRKFGLEQNDAVTVTNGKGAFSESLAEYVLASILHFNKQVPRLIHNKNEKKWDKFEMKMVKGKTVLFVGYGNIAQQSAELLRRIYGNDLVLKALRRSKSHDSEANQLIDEFFYYDDPNFKNCLVDNDFVISTLPGTEQTLDFFGAAEFEKMGPECVFISIGRGLVVDEVALANALNAGTIKGAALDVFKVEPLPQESPLWTCPNTLLSPHNADYTEDYFELGWEVFLSNLEARVAKKPFVTEINKNMGY